MFLSIKDLKKSFGEDEYKTEVLKGIDFEIEKGEICVLLGPSGSGKSTFLRCLNFLETADKGIIDIGGHIVDCQDIGKNQKKKIIDLIIKLQKEKNITNIYHFVCFLLTYLVELVRKRKGLNYVNFKNRKSTC